MRDPRVFDQLSVAYGARNITVGRALHDRLVLAGSAVDIGRPPCDVGDIVETSEREPVTGKGVIMTHISTTTAAVCTQ
jgi:hypothetical protein